MPSPDFTTLPQVDLGKVVRSEIDIYGTICYTRQEFEGGLHFIEDGRVKVDPSSPITSLCGGNGAGLCHHPGQAEH